MKRCLQRVLAQGERHRAWLVTTLVVTAVIVGIFFGTKGEYWIGLSGMGLFWGVLATVLGALSMLYSVRKRSWVGGNPRFKGTMVAWLWSHVYLGGLALVVAVLHAGTGLTRITFTSGWVLFIAFALVVVTGIIWRLVYHRLPSRVQPTIRNYSPQDAQDRAEHHRIEIEKLSAGKSDAFRRLKDHILEEGLGQALSPDIHSKLSELVDDEQEALKEIGRRNERMRNHHQRQQKQGKVHWMLQGWRLLHVPAALLTMVVLPWHIISATSEAKFFQPDDPKDPVFESAERCGRCHQKQHDEWRRSMHAHALSSPLTIVQTRLAVRNSLRGESPITKQVCVACHGPVATRVMDDPVEPLLLDHDAGKEGITCVVCHQFTGSPDDTYEHATPRDSANPNKPTNSAIGAWPSYHKKISGDRTVLHFKARGPRETENLYHTVRRSKFADNPSQLCASCHNVHADRSSQGMEMLKLQSIYDEWETAGAGTPCLDCHSGPEKNNHLFIGVDYPIDNPDINREDREWLLQKGHKGESAASIEIKNEKDDDGRFEIHLNVPSGGHNFPSGFAFARQVWLEVIVTRDGDKVFSSGVLDSDTQDLCDYQSMNDMGGSVEHHLDCNANSDPQLVNLQQRLTNPDGKEVVIQYIEGGPEPRVRREPKRKDLIPLEPGDEETYPYQIDKLAGEEVEVKVRLRFRHIPPYFVRRLASDYERAKLPELELDDCDDLKDCIKNIEVIDIDSASGTIRNL